VKIIKIIKKIYKRVINRFKKRRKVQPATAQVVPEQKSGAKGAWRGFLAGCAVSVLPSVALIGIGIYLTFWYGIGWTLLGISMIALGLLTVLLPALLGSIFGFVIAILKK
jgi:hypothetical protein